MRDAVAGRGTFNLIHTDLVVKVDFLVRKDSEYRREEFRRRRRMSVDDLQLFVVAPEDLIISKLEWARDTRSEVQLGDVRNLLDERGAGSRVSRTLGDSPRPRRALPGGRRMSRHVADRESLDSRGRHLTDTSPGVARMYRQMLLRRSGVERVRMGASMFATARALALASIRATEPSVSAAALRRALFVRFYGGDFCPEERERIVAWLGRDPASPGDRRDG